MGDRYVDITGGIWSPRYNYGKGSAKGLLDAYVLPPLDRRKLAVYRRWWNSP